MIGNRIIKHKKGCLLKGKRENVRLESSGLLLFFSRASSEVKRAGDQVLEDRKQSVILVRKRNGE